MGLVHLVYFPVPQFVRILADLVILILVIPVHHIHIFFVDSQQLLLLLL